ncbi:hypothetical protein D7S86_16555 [Pararobbsia silviterrae]|uniref:Uncharacterized protein n=1 Tax=Pararobbsia silviterrae TaxID=1792498 RepID=A0A494XRV7_9BURK|nr:hypothetical protein D7S86_16555 [Pararobbsia silviterrae]
MTSRGSVFRLIGIGLTRLPNITHQLGHARDRPIRRAFDRSTSARIDECVSSLQTRIGRMRSFETDTRRSDRAAHAGRIDPIERRRVG